MATNNAINLQAAGIAIYDGAGTFSAVELTKGQLLTFNGTSSEYVAFPVGANGQALTANDSEDTGLEYVTINGVTGNDTTGTTQTLAVNNLYVANNVALVTFTLPATATVGTLIYIIGNGSGGWTIAQNADQIINHGSLSSTTGVGGSVSSSNQYDCVILCCTVEDTEWSAFGVQGNLTIV